MSEAALDEPSHERPDIRLRSRHSLAATTQISWPLVMPCPVATSSSCDDAVARRGDLVLHLHRLDDADHLARPRRPRRPRPATLSTVPCMGLPTAPEPAPPPAARALAASAPERCPRRLGRVQAHVERTAVDLDRDDPLSRRCVPSDSRRYRCCPMRERLRHLLRALGQLLGLHEPVARAALDEARLGEQRRVEPEQRRWPLDPELGERPQHPPPRGLAIRVVDDQLGDHRVVEPRDLVSRPNAGVDPHARARRAPRTP